MTLFGTKNSIWLEFVLFFYLKAVPFFPHLSRLSAYVANSNLESPLGVAISAQNLNAALSILSFGGQSIPPSNFVSDPLQSTFASPLFRAFKMMLDDGRFDKNG